MWMILAKSSSRNFFRRWLWRYLAPVGKKIWQRHIGHPEWIATGLSCRVVEAETSYGESWWVRLIGSTHDIWCYLHRGEGQLSCQFMVRFHQGDYYCYTGLSSLNSAYWPYHIFHRRWGSRNDLIQNRLWITYIRHLWGGKQGFPITNITKWVVKGAMKTIECNVAIYYSLHLNLTSQDTCSWHHRYISMRHMAILRIHGVSIGTNLGNDTITFQSSVMNLERWIKITSEMHGQFNLANIFITLSRNGPIAVYNYRYLHKRFMHHP